ncbi:uncharacterized protein N7483_007202 [Penicillium malachiteum]|uniref:uncharacterized protein n=1 Tax=Penicillium malachiteum TaxID=1324776 RepID=UPI0025484E1E|nr:uncharacterized protein N7483_007202 [Penicillium malachiteum]KAJ5725845.1 hypothetical protein N7483_007202 [Penicillium malachiteum]
MPWQVFNEVQGVDLDIGRLHKKELSLENADSVALKEENITHSDYESSSPDADRPSESIFMVIDQPIRASHHA